MKKEITSNFKFKFALLIISTLLITSLFVFYSNNASAALSTTNLEDTTNTLNENLQNIPKTPQEIRDRYLRQEWNNIISKMTFIGPIHNFFIANPVIFNLLLREPYSFSLTFFSIFILWLCIAIWMKNIFKPIFKQKWMAWLIGFAIAIALAWVTAIKTIVFAVFTVIFAEDAWWIRLILWLALLVAMILVFFVDHMIAQNIKKSKEAKEKAEMKQNIAENKAFVKGAKSVLK